MSQANDLLNSQVESHMYEMNDDNEAHIIVQPNRKIKVPEALRHIAVQYDHNIETVTFDCPRYWDNVDMSEMTIYINYMRPSKVRGQYEAKNVTVDEEDQSVMHFTWTLTRNATLEKGKLRFLICVKELDGDGQEKIHWNSSVNDEMEIEEGFECDDAVESMHADIITDLLLRMDRILVATTPILDTSLTERGLAADAKATGDRVNEVVDNFTGKIDSLTSSISTETISRRAEIATERKRIDKIVTLKQGSTTGDAELQDIRIGYDGNEYSSAGDAVRGQFGDLAESSRYLQSAYINLFSQSDDEYLEGQIIEQDGSFVSSSNAFTTGFIPVKKGKTYIFNRSENLYGTNVPNVCCFDSSKKYLKFVRGEYDYNTRRLTLLIEDDDIAYIRTSASISTLSTFMVSEGLIYPDHVIPYGRTVLIKENVICFADNLKSPLSADKASFVNYSANIFNKNDIVTGYYIMTNGTIAEAANYAYSGFIPVSPLETYTVNKHSSISSAVIGSFYDKYFCRIDPIVGTDSDDGRYYSFETPEKCAYIRVNLFLNHADVWMVSRGGYPSEYVPYKLSLAEDFGLNATQTEEMRKIAESDILYGKSVSFNGDSICQGAGFSGGYGKIIADIYGMSYQNIGVGGGTITGDTVSSSGVNRHWICRTIDKTNYLADYIILEGGVNDAALGVPIGSITSGYTAELDDTTFCGAMESICKQLITGFPGKKIGFIFVHKMTSKYSTEYTGDDNYYKAQKAICEKWGVPYLDLNTLCPPLCYIDSLKTAYTKDGDGWHPNEQGYKLYYVPKIVKWMESL